MSHTLTGVGNQYFTIECLHSTGPGAQFLSGGRTAEHARDAFVSVLVLESVVLLSSSPGICIEQLLSGQRQQVALLNSVLRQSLLLIIGVCVCEHPTACYSLRYHSIARIDVSDAIPCIPRSGVDTWYGWFILQ